MSIMQNGTGVVNLDPYPCVRHSVMLHPELDFSPVSVTM